MKITFAFLLLVLFGCQYEPREELDTVKSTDQSTPALLPDAYNVALLIMEGTYNTELTAPMDIFHHTKFRDSIRPMNVFTIANTKDVITTFEGLKIIPDFDYTKEHPTIDILVIPAAEHNLDSDLKNTELLDFIRSSEKTAEYVVSHCDGAFVLAKTGLLDDRVSTTFPGDVAAYKTMFPQLDVREDVLFVHDGKFITSAGGAKSFEASLYLCELLYGKMIADQLARGLVIDWELNEISYVKI